MPASGNVPGGRHCRRATGTLDGGKAAPVDTHGDQFLQAALGLSRRRELLCSARWLNVSFADVPLLRALGTIRIEFDLTDRADAARREVRIDVSVHTGETTSAESAGQLLASNHATPCTQGPCIQGLVRYFATPAAGRRSFVMTSPG